jgi:GNAT superfamily N-acetyltransferase
MDADRGSLIVRRARASDKEAVVDFCSRIWEGWDYLPRVYDRWLRDPRGAFLVAELASRPVGTDKITVLSPGEIWLEGLRVDPEARGWGVARAINRKAMEVIASLSPRTVRFGTVADNLASRHMGEKDGFRLIFECRRMVAGAMKGKPSTPSSPETAPQILAGPEALDAIMAFLRGSENCRLMKGLYAWGWTFQEMSREFVGQVLAREGALAVRGDGSIDALALFLPQRHGPRSCLGFIDGSPENMAGLASRFRAIAAQRGIEEVFAMVPQQAVQPLSEAGFQSDYPVEVVVYELSGERLQEAMKKIFGG